MHVYIVKTPSWLHDKVVVAPGLPSLRRMTAGASVTGHTPKLFEAIGGAMVAHEAPDAIARARAAIRARRQP